MLFIVFASSTFFLFFSPPLWSCFLSFLLLSVLQLRLILLLLFVSFVVDICIVCLFVAVSSHCEICQMFFH